MPPILKLPRTCSTYKDRGDIIKTHTKKTMSDPVHHKSQKEYLFQTYIVIIQSIEINHKRWIQMIKLIYIMVEMIYMLGNSNKQLAIEDPQQKITIIKTKDFNKKGTHQAETHLPWASNNCKHLEAAIIITSKTMAVKS